jgi:phosphoribosylformimino-5-aminoimidazole carboxamide ribotide isomerase
MRIVPVLDVCGGTVVHAVGGRRSEYRPIRSRLTQASDPLSVARALREQFGLDECYLADLDAIGGAEPAWATFDALHADGFRLLVDAGVRRLSQACQLADAGVESIVVGLETVAGPEELAAIVRALGRRVVFSLDLFDGEPLGDREAWWGWDAEAIAAWAITQGVSRLLVLDVARVGVSGGVGTRQLCARLCATSSGVEISTGGGVRDRRDLEELSACGVRCVLIASALHDGRLTRADIVGL